MTRHGLAWVLGVALWALAAAASAQTPRLLGEAGLSKHVPAGGRAVQLNEAATLESAAGASLDIAAPGQPPLLARYRKHREFADGRLLWVGQARTGQGRQPVVLVFGADGGFGVVPDAAGKLWAVKSHARGGSWLEPLNDIRPAPVCPPAGCAAPPASDAVRMPAPKSGPALRMSDDEARKAAAGPSRIDVLGIYTDDVVRLYGSDEAAQTYYLSLVALANQALADSGVNASYEVVAQVRSSHDTNMSVYNTQIALSRNELSDGLDVYALREQHSADLVAMLRDGAAHREAGGVGHLTTSPTNILLNFGYSVSAFGGYVMAHELGHNLGAHHDVETETDASGKVNHGAYDFAHGLRESVPYAFHTIMAYRQGAQQRQPYFSSPDLWECLGRPCGIVGVADNVRALNLMAPRIARLRDPAAGFVVSDAEALEPDAGTTPAWFRVRLSEPAPAGGLPIRAWTEAGTATPGQDYVELAPAAYRVADGEREITISVNLLADSVVEPAETFQLVVEADTGSGPVIQRGQGLVTNDDPRLQLAGRLRFEGAPAPTQPFYIYLEDANWRLPTQSAMVHPPGFEFQIGAMANTTYDLEADLQNHPPFPRTSFRLTMGSSNRFFEGVVRPGGVVSGQLQFVGAAKPVEPVRLTAWGATGDPNSGYAYDLQPPDFNFSIDVQPGTPFRLAVGRPPAPFAPAELVFGDISQAQGQQVLTLSSRPTMRVDDYVVDEGDAGEAGTLYLQVALATDSLGAMNGTWGDVTYRWRRVGGTATLGSDFGGTGEGSGVIPSGIPNGWISMPLIGDDTPEPDETVEIEVYDVQGADLANTRAVATIRDDDSPAPPVLGLTDATVYEGDDGSRALTFTARLESATADPVRFDVRTIAGTATAGSDFTSTTLAGLEIAPGQVERRFSVPVLGDAVDETDESFVVEIHNVTGAQVSWPAARGHILDDDGPLPSAVAAADDWRAVDSDAGHLDLPLSNLPELPDARFLATALVEPLRGQATLPAGTANLHWLDVPATAEDAEFMLYAAVRAPAGASLRLLAGIDTGAADPADGDARCSHGSGGDGVAMCELRVVRAAGAPATRYWVRVRNEGADASVHTDLALVPLAGDGRLVATGPGHLPAGQVFDVRLAWDDPRWLAGESRLGYLLIEARAGERVYFEPLRLERTGTRDAARVLLPGTPLELSVPAGASHERVMVTLPPYATGLQVSTSALAGAQGAIRLEAVHDPAPTGPGIAPAPAGAALAVSSGQGLAQTLAVPANTLAGRSGRWYLRIINTGGSRADLRITATLATGTGAAAVRPGSYFNAARGGHGLFLYPAGNQWAALWYTYLEDRSPTWYYMQADAPGADGLWRGRIYRAAWNGGSNHLTQVGDMLVTPGEGSDFSLAVRMDGYSSEQTMTPFLAGCPTVGNAPLDASAHWFEPALSGYGFSVQVHPNYEFLAAFLYDDLGRPRFLTAERGGAFAAGSGDLPLYQLRGFGPLADYTAPDRVEVGRLDRQYDGAGLASIDVQARYAGTLPGGWWRAAPMVPLSGRQGCTP